MDNRVYIVVAIIVFTGLLGGFGGFLITPIGESQNDPQRRVLARSLFLGVIAAITVPLFLSLTKSGLMGNIFAADTVPPRPPAFEDYLVFAGLCVIASVSARRFLSSVTDRILQRVDQAERTARDANIKAEQAKDEALQGETADEPNAAPPAEIELASAMHSSQPKGPLSPEERGVLEALTQRTYRTRTGIADDSGIPKNRISEVLEGLADRKLALPTTSPRTGGSRWFITKRGEAALRSEPVVAAG
jgi:hypothetical protein